jgi:hypothetical protein
MTPPKSPLRLIQEPFSWRDIHSLKFVVQVVFSFTILLFCLFQLAISDRNTLTPHFYGGFITTILAWWMPSPMSTSKR